ncbi:hypothetical protein E3N88_08357 [Mikania micrantha]|uniref:PGR5-like protein 1A, chloroplastic n=1 Tax=Mikania micrantha TaxID=192012 RepID=A0A5N6PI66_9ASTR|nr:hypothetical protein E3N88_08338 [Mikania micrantha]KAD6453651.1 hypothetical protein E3N88_08357 [Mikania micrantha]
MASKLGFTITSSRFFTAPIRRPSSGLTLYGSYRLSASKTQPIQLIGREFASRRRLIIISPRATTDQPGQVKEEEEEVVDSNIIPYCSLDKQKKKTIGEMEQEFLQALQAFYYEGKAIMSNEEFDNLKEELMWEGSSVVMLSSEEQKFLEASMAYISGNPIMSDEEFDKLKMLLKKDGSDIVAEGPRCSLRSRKVYSDLTVDYLKMFLINVPAAVVAIGLAFVQIVEQRTIHSLEPYCQFPVGVLSTTSNAQTIAKEVSHHQSIIKEQGGLVLVLPSISRKNTRLLPSVLCHTRKKKSATGHILIDQKEEEAAGTAVCIEQPERRTNS